MSECTRFSKQFTAVRKKAYREQTEKGRMEESKGAQKAKLRNCDKKDLK